MLDNLLTVVTKIRVPPKFRNKDWVNDFLNSLHKQIYPVKVIIVDFGSHKDHRGWLKEVVKQYNEAQLIEMKTISEDMGFGIASNVGIKAVKTEYILLTDIDCLFEENFTSVVINELIRAEQGFPRRIVNCQVIAKSINSRPDQLNSQSDIGCCIGLPKDWLMKVHGFDENYKGWGIEDVDLVMRARVDGFNQVWINKLTKFYHREHPWFPRLWDKENKDYYFKHKGYPIIRNLLNEWGKL